MKHPRNSAFTLVEVMVAASIAVVVGGAIMAFYVQALRVGYVSQQQITLQTTMRTITSELITNASRAHEMILYSSAAAADRADETSRLAITLDEDDEEIHPTGDFAVFIYYELPKPSDQPKHRIRKLIGYYTEQVDSGPAKLTRIVIDLSGAPSTDTVEEILEDNWLSATAGATLERKTFAPRVTPLALSDDYDSETGSPQLFFLTSTENVAVCGQLLESATRNDTKDRRTLTRTFFFTVSVRA
jgi:type II secretory pathway pseudopilin PulG